MEPRVMGMNQREVGELFGEKERWGEEGGAV